jgi:hypothetical protein
MSLQEQMKNALGAITQARAALEDVFQEAHSQNHWMATAIEVLLIQANGMVDAATNVTNGVLADRPK